MVRSIPFGKLQKTWVVISAMQFSAGYLDINFVAVRSPPQVKFNSLNFMHKNISSPMICVNVKRPRFR